METRGQKHFPSEFTENCFAVFDESSRVILLMWYCQPLSCELHVAISLMDMSKIFHKIIGGEYNSISLHFGKLCMYFFYFTVLDVSASENFSARQVFQSNHL